MAEANRGTWAADLVDYFQELGGEAHYSDLYRHIEANPRRKLGKEWQAVVRRTIEEHSSDTTIWHKRELADLFRSVEGLGAGRWALRQTPPVASTFALLPGQKIKRTSLHEEFGGSTQGGLIPSAQSPNIFLFADPQEGPQHGYVDGWKDDGCFHYTGSGQYGDQEMVGPNKALLSHKARGRRVRLFHGSKGVVEYEGELELDAVRPYYETDAPETNDGPTRKVIVFRLNAIDSVLKTGPVDPAPKGMLVVTDVDIEAQYTEKMFVNPKSAVTEAERREAKLVIALQKYLKAKNIHTTRKKIEPPEEAKPLLTDAFVESLNLLVEAKGTCERGAFRMAIGQLADYRRFFARAPQCAILLPSRPRVDLVELAQIEGIGLIWQTHQGFEATINFP